MQGMVKPPAVPWFSAPMISLRCVAFRKPKGWAELGAALIILARDADLRRRMGEYGHEKARRYSWEAVASQIVEVYEQARITAAGRIEANSAQIEEIHVHDAV